MLKPPSFERQDEFQFELYKETLEELGFSNKDSFRPVPQWSGMVLAPSIPPEDGKPDTENMANYGKLHVFLFRGCYKLEPVWLAQHFLCESQVVLSEMSSSKHRVPIVVQWFLRFAWLKWPSRA